jgi:hypothetical protein
MSQSRQRATSNPHAAECRNTLVRGDPQTSHRRCGAATTALVMRSPTRMMRRTNAGSAAAQPGL